MLSLLDAVQLRGDERCETVKVGMVEFGEMLLVSLDREESLWAGSNSRVIVALSVLKQYGKLSELDRLDEVMIKS